jgi:hypothetical protein
MLEPRMVAASIHLSEDLGQRAFAVFDFMTPSSHGCFMMDIGKESVGGALVLGLTAFVRQLVKTIHEITRNFTK